MKIIAVMNKKGGDGKTTVTANLAAWLSKKYKVLIIDSDEQGNATHHFGLSDFNTSITDLYEKKPFELIKIKKNLYIIPADEDFIGMDIRIQPKMNREQFLSKGIKKINQGFDFVFIDCPPSIGVITLNALAAAQYILLPVRAGRFSLKGAQVMIDFISEVREDLNEDLQLLGIVLNQYNDKQRISNLILKEFSDKGWNPALFDSKIRKTTALELAQFDGKSIFDYDKKSNGTKDFIALSKEFIKKIKSN